MRAILTAVAALSIFTMACSKAPPEPQNFEDLEPYENPFGPDDSRYPPQPERNKPQAMVFCGDRGWLFVALPGSVDRPGQEVVVVDVERRVVIERYGVGRGPVDLALHPGGDHLVVANRFSNYLSVVDMRSGATTRHGVDFYTEALLFDAGGKRLYLANRRRNSVQVMEVGISDGNLHFHGPGSAEISVGFNPQKLILSEEGEKLYVASPAALMVSVIEVAQLRQVGQVLSGASPLEVGEVGSDGPVLVGEETQVGVERIWVGAPPFDLVLGDEYLYLATLSQSTHHPPDVGDDVHPYIPPTQGSPNEGFEALQNEIALFRRDDLEAGRRYTSSSFCCPDVRDVSPEDPERGHLVPDESLRIVDGALPTAMAAFERAGRSHLLVAYGGSNQIQRFEIDESGGLLPGPVISVGFDPRALVVDDEGARAFVSNRLGESVSVIDLPSFEVVDEIWLGADGAPAFPATDAEIGELLFFSGANFSVDGDQTCNHCHFDRGNIGKFFSMPLLRDPRGSRMTPDVRGLFDARPWFVEGAMDEENISAVLAEMAHIDNFCCEGEEDPQGCAENPPPRCEELPYSMRASRRDHFFLQAARELFGRQRSFGDALDVALDFDGMTRLLGLFLIREPALLPNPNGADGRAVERGRLIFESAETGCVVCHPAPTFGVSSDVNPFQTPLVFGPVIEPNRDGDGKNLDLLNQAFLQQFPDVRQDRGHIHLKAPSLRGIWDRAPGFYHDGRARTLREALATPGHPALRPSERGYNVADGVLDSHGGTSHLSADDLEDLIQFLLTL